MAVAVLGGGAWGGVLAGIAARHGHDVVLWEIDRAAADALARDRTSPRSVAELPPARRRSRCRATSAAPSPAGTC